MSKLMPKYTPWEAISVALDLGKRALEEIRTLARTPGPQGPAGTSTVLVTLDYGFALRSNGTGDQTWSVPQITQSVIDNGVVVGYIQLGSAGTWTMLPHVFVNGTFSHTMLLTFSLGTVRLEARDVPAPPLGSTSYSGKLRLLIISP